MSVDVLKKALIDFIRGKAVKFALKKILGSAVAGGFKGWLVKFIATELFDELAVPVINLSVRKGRLIYDKTSGKIKVKRIEKAKEDGNISDYSDHIGGV